MKIEYLYLIITILTVSLLITAYKLGKCDASYKYQINKHTDNVRIKE